MEVTTGDHITFAGEYQRVVGHGVGFDHQYFGGLTELGQAGAHDLWLAAQRVRVLDLAAVFVGGRDFAAITEQIAVAGGGIDLATLTTGGMDTRVERRTRTQHRFDRQGTDRGRCGEQILAFEQAAQGIGGGCLGAVEQRQTFLGRQGQRLKTGNRQGFGGRQPLAVVARLAFTEQYQRHVRQRCQVAGSAHRTFERDVRVDLGVDQRDQRVDHLAADAGEATAQAVDLEHHDQPYQGVVDRLANAGGVRQHQRTLQVFQVMAGDAGRRQQAKTGVDAVGGAVFREDLLDTSDAVVDLLIGAGIQLEFYRLLVDRTQLSQGQGAGLQGQFSHVNAPYS
ncbi:hypothetical protein D3C81_1177050 [compost metagenome]